jgi:chromosomal replication initiator protein
MEPVSNPPTAECVTEEQGRTQQRDQGRDSAMTEAPRHPWDGFVTGPENELAMAAAQAIARGQREGISPLVVHGLSGVGKSRMLAGLVTERLRRQTDVSVAHLNAEAFATACFEAAGTGTEAGWSALRGRFRSVNLFVLEDLEGLGRVRLAQDELTHTLDALETAGATVVVSAQSAPGTWSRLEWPVRLVNRLLGGLMVRIEPPGLASRRRYVLQRAREHRVPLLAEAVEILAQAADSYRSIDGWIARLALEGRLKHAQEDRGGSQNQPVPRGDRRMYSHRGPEALDPGTVATILAEETHLALPLVTIDAIARAVAARFSIRLGVLRGKSRRASVVTVRHLAMHLARTITGSSFAVIGTYFGGRDPATVRYACKVAALRLNEDSALAVAVATLGPPWSRTES